MVSQIESFEAPTGTVWMSVAALAVTSFRDDGLCPDHVERLVELGGAWPPIVVMRSGGQVVDGAHRVAAARRLGMARIEAMLFDGNAEEAFVEFVRRNVTHGLLLTLRERKRAALRILGAHRSWSDRRVAELCGLSPKTVGRLRSDGSGCPSEETPQLDADVRIGRDERRRPAQRGPVRARVVEALREQPGASLRAIAAAVGVSPETVRLVRMNMAALPEPAEPESAPPWQADIALASATEGADFLDWFEQTAVADADLVRAETVPLSRVYELADEARRRAALWLRLARTLEARSTKANER